MLADLGDVATRTAQILDDARAAGRASLSEPQAKQVIASLGIRVPCGCVIDARGAPDLAAVSSLRAPLVAKLVSGSVLHKSDSGGVILGLKDAAGVAGAIDTIAARHAGLPVDGYLIEEMAPAGVELVIGGHVDPSFGPAVMVGFGGVLVEVLDDISMRLCPITRGDANEMLDSLRGVALLAGVRGRPAVDREALVDALLAIGGAQGLLIRHSQAIESLDINPLIASSTGCIAVDARILLRDPQACPLRGPLGHPMPLPGAARDSADLSRLLSPRSIVVIGASTEGGGLGNAFIRNLQQFGFAGSLSIIHPTAPEIDGVRCYPSLAALPEAVDYAYVALPASRVTASLAGAAGKLAFAQVVSSGFAEVAGGEALQAQLLEGARLGGVRVVGPNCLGVHSPRAQVTFMDNVVDVPGSFGVVSQSGGLGVDLLRRGQARGLRFSSMLTVGNCADVSVVEVLDQLLCDPGTRVIGLYLESVANGRALLDCLQSRRVHGGQPKPIVLLKGGSSTQGQRAAQSHTGALASDERLWASLARQTGVAQVDTLDAFIDTALTLQLIAPNYARPTRRIGLFGNGGGTSVLACDAFARYGLAVPPFEQVIVQQLEALDLPPGASVLNPIDAPAGVLAKDQGALVGSILDIAQRAGDIDAIVVHLNLPVIVGYYDEALLRNLIRAVLRSRDAAASRLPFVLVLRSDGSAAIDAIRRTYRDEAMALGVAVYDEIPQAAQALAALAWVERHGRPVQPSAS
ncbi:MAG: acetate--CoA ligase family protein [Burkholderiaceae bacterium]|nr:acetate--CoA ligase family protein [Burkholderiaceae bacterium]